MKKWKLHIKVAEIVFASEHVLIKTLLNSKYTFLSHETKNKTRQEEGKKEENNKIYDLCMFTKEFIKYIHSDESTKRIKARDGVLPQLGCLNFKLLETTGLVPTINKMYSTTKL